MNFFRDYFEAILFPQLLLLTLVVSWADDKLGVKVLPLALETDDRFISYSFAADSQDSSIGMCRNAYIYACFRGPEKVI